MIKIKYGASLITTGRIAGSFLLLFTNPLSIQFFMIYFLCCISDILDGYIARKTKTTSELGAALDSAADFVLIAVMLLIFIPLLPLEKWMLYWIGLITLTRFLSAGIGYLKYRKLAFLHTYANKITGAACACFPVLYRLFGLKVTIFILCGAASFSSLEEIMISILSKKMDRNIRGLFFK